MGNSLREINNLLSQTKEITRRYQEVERITGNGFNLLGLLRMGHYEVKTHSPVLADLLNPQGSHGQGSVFLRLFLNTCIPNTATFMGEPESVVVDEEKHIGTVDDATATGGRIDIHLRSASTGEILVIENKIHAGLGHQQLDRYLNYIRENAKGNGVVLFLTLFGDDPIPEDENLICISYHDEIINWLRLCRKEVATVPTVRESLTIYINLLCKLTNQSPDQKMNSEITRSILQSRESLEAYTTMASQDIQTAVFEQITPGLEEIAEKLSLRLAIKDGKVTSIYHEFFYHSENWINFCIGFSFDSKNCCNLLFGFCDGSKLEEGQRSKLAKMFAEKMGPERNSQAWAAFQWWDEFRNWYGNTLVEVVHGSFLYDLEGKVRVMREIADKFASEFQARG